MIPATDNRAMLLRALHAAARQAGIGDETRRDLMERLTGKRSAGEMTEDELQRVVSELRRQAPGERRSFVAGVNARAIVKLANLCYDLWHLGAMSKPAEAVILGFVRRQTGRDYSALRFASAGDLNAAIDGAREWLGRLGVRLRAVEWSNEAIVDLALIECQWRILVERGAMPEGGLSSWLARNYGDGELSLADSRHAVYRLGNAIRKTKRPS